MRIFKSQTFLSISLCLILTGNSFSANAQQLDSRMLQDWEARWERVVNGALGGYLERAAGSYLAALDEETLSRALDELAQLLYPSVSWEALGSDVVDNMRNECGLDVLSGMEPYFVDGDASSIPSDVIDAYSQCAVVAMQNSFELVTTALESKEQQIAAIHSKYGIADP